MLVLQRLDEERENGGVEAGDCYMADEEVLRERPTIAQSKVLYASYQSWGAMALPRK